MIFQRLCHQMTEDTLRIFTNDFTKEYAITDIIIFFSESIRLEPETQCTLQSAERTGDVCYLSIIIGLFFAKKVAEDHGGEILLANSKKTGGAKVEISFMSSDK